MGVGKAEVAGSDVQWHLWPGLGDDQSLELQTCRTEGSERGYGFLIEFFSLWRCKQIHHNTQQNKRVGSQFFPSCRGCQILDVVLRETGVEKLSLDGGRQRAATGDPCAARASSPHSGPRQAASASDNSPHPKPGDAPWWAVRGAVTGGMVYRPTSHPLHQVTK